MNLIERMAVDATHTVYVMSNPDGTDCEFLLLNGKDSESERESLRARWGGRNLGGVGIAFIEHGIPRVLFKQEPSDFLITVRLTAAFARFVVELAVNDSLRADDGVIWCERLYALQDTRTEA
jgi:hypothetical protein